MQRRLLLQSTTILAISLAFIRNAFGKWPAARMETTDFTEALGSIGKGEESDKIVFEAPETAENGAVVPFTIDASNFADHVANINLLLDSNDKPLVASFDIEPSAVPYVALRVKMAKSGTATAVVIANGKAYHTQREVKVTAGGCA